VTLLQPLSATRPERKVEEKELTSEREFDTLRKFAQNTAARPVNKRKTFPDTH
jgi:hypothetical protein